MAKKKELLKDRISALPEPLIHQILSSLEMQDVLKTRFLSKRWRKVWTSTPVLKFRCDVGQTELEKLELARLITNSILLYEGPKIKEFEVVFDWRDVNTSIVDSWVHFAVSRDVEVLCLHFFDGDWVDLELEDALESGERYGMPQYLSDCRSLKSLDLKFCELKVPISFPFSFLKRLRLEFVNFDSLDTSSCPLLEDVYLVYCNVRSNLSIYSPNERLKLVKVKDCFTLLVYEFGLSIYAPRLLNVSFRGGIRTYYDIKDLSSVISAELRFDSRLGELADDFVNATVPLTKLFANLGHVKNLQLSHWCIRALSSREMDGLKALACSATNLRVQTDLDKSDLPGLACLMRGSPHLQSLKIDLLEKPFFPHRLMWRLPDDVEENTFWKLLGLELSASFHLKVVEICYFLESVSYNVKPSEFPTGELPKLWKNKIKLVETLLSCCKELDGLNIIINEYHQFEPELLFILANKLLGFPRASANAKVYLS